VSDVKEPVLAVVAPTVPLMLMEAVPVKLVTVPLEGVPRAPPGATKSVPAVAAEIAVPLPLRTPVTEVAKVRMGVAPPELVPENPLDDAIDTLDTPPEAVEAMV
jgi:hypothetical protein